MITEKQYINIAKEIAKSSKCVSKQVGAIIVKDGRILSTGYNGTPAGYKNCNDHWCGKYTDEHHEWSKKHEIHAEMNSIIWAARKGISVEGASIYVTLEPCYDCSKNIIASGIKEIIYDVHYEYTNSEELGRFIEDNNVKVRKANIN